MVRSKASAIAHPIQGLIKYHGLKDFKRRIPYHDSISVCAAALHSHATVEFSDSLSGDEISINDAPATPRQVTRVREVIDAIRSSAKQRLHARIATKNSFVGAKGLGFSASAFAAIGMAAKEALHLKISNEKLSEFVRLGSGSASRSLVGGFAIWYHNRAGRSFAEQLSKDVPLHMIIIPQTSDVLTEEAHEDVISSPFFRARLRYVKGVLPKMRKAVLGNDVNAIGELAEADSLNLHAVTMTGAKELVLFSEGSIHVMRLIRNLRGMDKVPAWFSLDTGPSVFVNTSSEYASEIVKRLRDEGFNPIESGVGSDARIVDQHLF